MVVVVILWQAVAKGATKEDFDSLIEVGLFVELCVRADTLYACSASNWRCDLMRWQPRCAQQIHPTDAEAFCNMEVARSSVTTEEDYTASGGCGGGKCG